MGGESDRDCSRYRGAGGPRCVRPGQRASEGETASMQNEETSHGHVRVRGQPVSSVKSADHLFHIRRGTDCDSRHTGDRREKLRHHSRRVFHRGIVARVVDVMNCTM